MSTVERLLLVLLPVCFGIGFLAPGAAVEPLAEEVVLTFTDPEIVESSGLVAADGLVVTVNDSGDGNRVFTVDAATGETVGVTRWQGEAYDIEALAPAGPGRAWVGDIGDNQGIRDSVVVAEVPYGRGDRTVEAATYELVYPDGAQDAESLLVDPATGRLHVVAKGFIGRLYAAPERLDPDGPNLLRAVDEVLGIATDAAFFPDGRHLVVRNYLQAAVYTWPGLDRVAQLDLPRQPQGEGIAVTPEGEVLISSEGRDSELLRVELPADVRAAVDGEEPPAAADPAPDADPGTGADADPGAESSPVRVAEEREVWPWVAGGLAAVVLAAVLLRARRSR